MSEITITAILTAKEGKEADLLKELKDVVAPSRAEEGCITYALHESIDQKQVFVFYETWKDEASLKAHIETEHYKRYRKNAKNLMEKREVYRLNKI